ncbi:hypothetical protein EDB19DRAFT_2030564 [Suillus lakei]|nr:hypothetical protein EDB19DRAFT_2030564 [Suillus lakei]
MKHQASDVRELDTLCIKYSLRILHRHSHQMDDKTKVMFTNLRNDPRMIESEQIEEAIKPFKDRKEVDEKFAKLGTSGKDDLKTLQNLMALRKGWGRDLTIEPQMTPGILALHVTSWDWNNSTSKNSKRDVEPFVKAILFDLRRDRARRENLFNDPLVAGLRKVLEDLIAKHTKAVNMIGENGRTMKRKRWLWYDGAEIPSHVAPTKTVSLVADDYAMRGRIQRLQELEAVTTIAPPIYHWSTTSSWSLRAPHTPPSQNLQMLPPDTVPFIRHTSGADYSTGDLKPGRNAVLTDLGRYLRVPFDCLVKCVGATPTLQDLQRIRNNLTESKILTDDESGLRWTDFTPPATSKGSEENVFEPLGRIIAEILEEVPNRGVSFLANPNGTPLSQRNNTSRPDGFLVLNNEKTQRKIHWFDIAVPFEFKKARDRESLRDDEEKIVWSLHSIMREDLLRRFAFGITMEDTQLRLWLSNRAFLAVTEPIDFFQNIDGVISLFYALGSASASSAMKELGWDPTVKRIGDGEGFQYKFTIGDEVFTTTREIATYSADSMVGRGTRVYEATDAEGTKVVVKDSWREAGCQSEGEILESILASCAEKLRAEELADARKHFVGVQLWKDVIIDDTLDETLDPMVAEEHNRTWKWVSINHNPSVSATPHLPSTGNVPDSDTGIPRRVHTRTIFLGVGVALNDITTLADILGCMSGALLASGTQFGSGGTMHFMAVEVETQGYLFFPPGACLLDEPSFRMNFLHDIESVWWAFTWIFFYHTDMDVANVDHSFDAQWKEYQVAFPGFVGRTSRRDFFLHIRRLRKKLDHHLLTKTCFDVCKYIIPDFATALQNGHRESEANYPSLALYDALLEDMHKQAAEYLNDAQQRASGIELYPLRNLWKQKRPRSGDETSLLPQNQGKKARYA